MLIEELIARKRDGGELAGPQLQELVSGICDGRVSDAQIGAFAMAVYFRGMSVDEACALTLAMRDSGTVLQWPELNGPVLDKHSTGGVGDLVSLILGPVLAACGAYVPMISGRGLGHTGGTIDKLESIPGFDAFPTVARMQRQVREIGIAIVGQSDELAPADRRIYAIRDSTATVPSVPLIVASILSKKLAEGLDALVMDVKCGNGAFMRELADASLLAAELRRVSRQAGLKCRAVLSNMDEPLAGSAGNALEVAEALEFLTGGHRRPRLQELVLELAAQMLVAGGMTTSLEEGRRLGLLVLDDGRAAEAFSALVAAQGGTSRLLESSDSLLPLAPVRQPLFPAHSGYVVRIDSRALGLAVLELGGGRQRAGDPIDPAVGMSELAAVGDPVGPDRPLAWIHAASEDGWKRAQTRLLEAFDIGEGIEPSGAVVLQTLE